ncbi:hypothetical protein KUCAC02_037660 [Chaenocephalus aceratus]|nr:hypothetical protein KUCAC02_037660 [Chaenocephalus aceratus]
MDAYDESGKSYDEVLKANKKFYKAYDKVNNETIKARESRDKALKTRDNGYEALKSLQAFQSTNNALQSWKSYNEAYKEAMDTKEANNEIIKAYDEALKDYKEAYEILVKNRDSVFKKESIYWSKLNKSVNVILESLETAIDEFNIKVSKKSLMKILNQYIDTDTYISNKVYKSYYKAWTSNNEAWTAWYEARTANNAASKANDETFKSLLQAYDTAKNYWYEASKSKNSWEPWEAVFKKYSKSLQEAYDAHSKYSQAWDESWKVWDESFKTRNEASKAYDEAWHSLLNLHKKNQKARFF